MDFLSADLLKLESRSSGSEYVRTRTADGRMDVSRKPLGGLEAS